MGQKINKKIIARKLLRVSINIYIYKYNVIIGFRDTAWNVMAI